MSDTAERDQICMAGIRLHDIVVISTSDQNCYSVYMALYKFKDYYYYIYGWDQIHMGGTRQPEIGLKLYSKVVLRSTESG